MARRRSKRLLARARRFARREAVPLARHGITSAMQSADELAIGFLGRDFEERLARVPIDRDDPDGTDPFGFDLDTAKYVAAVAAFFHRVYFRTEVFGIEQVPEGRVLLVSNHSGQLPIDGLLISAAMFLDAEPPRFMRSMVEKWTQTLPFVGTLFQRVGQVVGVPENARRLLARDEAVLVFPEGSRGVSKPFAQRYQLQRFGLGFMRLALETDTPIVPVAVVGGEEQYINLGNSETMARMLRMPVFPVVPQWMVPGGQLPLPTKVRIHFGAPLRFEGDADDEDGAIAAKVERVKKEIRRLLDAGLASREAVFR